MIFSSNETFTIQLGVTEEEYDNAVKDTFKSLELDESVAEKYLVFYKAQDDSTKELLRYIHPITMANLLKNENRNADEINFEELGFSFLYSISVREDRVKEVLDAYTKFFKKVLENKTNIIN